MRRGVAIGLLCIGATVWAQSPDTQPSPATQPASQPATRPTAKVDPAAQALLARLDAAYAPAKPLHVVGDIVGTFDVAGRSRRYELHVDGRTDGHGRFLHDVGSTGLIVNNGKTAFLYDRHRDSFASLPPTAAKLPAEQIPDAVVDVLLDENPALLLALTTEPSQLLRLHASGLRAATQPSALVVDRDTKRVTIELGADGTIAATQVDFTPLMRQRHAEGVVSAGARLVYHTPTHDTVDATVFDWQPPATATEFDLGLPPPTTAPTTNPTAP